MIGSILKMGLPSMFGFLSQHVYALVDAFWISRLPEGQAGVAAITFFNNVMFVFFAINSLIGPGSIAVISRRYGEKEYDKVEKAIKETLILKLFFGIVFAIGGLLLIEQTLHVLGASGEAFDMALDFGRIMLVGMPVFFATYSLFTAMRGVGNPHMAMALMLGSNVLNLILDPILMFGYFGFPALGIRGAAIATTVSFGAAFVLGLYCFYSDRTSVKLCLSGREAVSIRSMWTLIKIGIPAWLGEMSFSLSRLVIIPLVASYGTAVVAAYGIGMQVSGLGIAILVGIGLGLSSLVGQVVGSGKLNRAKRTGDQSIRFAAIVMAGFGLLVFLFAREIMQAFFASEETIREGVTFLRIGAISFPFYGALLMTEQVHVGVGLNSPVMIVNIVHSWLFQVLPIVVGISWLGLSQVFVWWQQVAATFLSATLFYLYYRRGKWLTVRV